MTKKNDGERTCITCGRIITDPNNKTGLCTSCAKKGKTGGAFLLLTGASVALKKYGKPLLNLAKNLIRK